MNKQLATALSAQAGFRKTNLNSRIFANEKTASFMLKARTQPVSKPAPAVSQLARPLTIVFPDWLQDL